jgi:HEAT repeat protein
MPEFESPSDENPRTVQQEDPSAGRPRGIEELPPVEPPSAGFIVQLFLIPMLIVGAIIGVYALFGRLAGGEQDWRTLVSELRNTNEHRRWRAAIGLAHLLKVDQDRGEDGQQLAQNPEIAKALLDVLEEQQSADIPREKALNQQQYLVTALGLLDQPKLVMPALQKLMLADGDQDSGVRIESLRSILLIANRTSERANAEDRPLLVEELVEIPSLVDDVVTVSRESDPLYRKVAAFALGFLPAPQSRQRLEVLLNDTDNDVKVNAAIGLSRQASTAGWPVYLEVLTQANDPSRQEQGIDLVILKNTLKAVGDLNEQWPDDQKQQLIELLESISTNHPERRIRTDAVKTLQTLKGQT